MNTTCPTCNGTGVAGRILGVPVPVICIACQGSGRTVEAEDTSNLWCWLFGHRYRITGANYATMEWICHCSRCGRPETEETPTTGHYEPEAGFVL